MKVSNHQKFACFDYENSENHKSPYELGDIVFKATDSLNQDGPQIGVIIQLHDSTEFRTDMFGNSDASEVTMATVDQIKTLRPNLLREIGLGGIKKDLEHALEIIEMIQYEEKSAKGLKELLGTIPPEFTTVVSKWEKSLKDKTKETERLKKKLYKLLGELKP